MSNDAQSIGGLTVGAAAGIFQTAQDHLGQVLLNTITVDVALDTIIYAAIGAAVGYSVTESLKFAKTKLGSYFKKKKEKDG